MPASERTRRSRGAGRCALWCPGAPSPLVAPGRATEPPPKPRSCRPDRGTEEKKVEKLDTGSFSREARRSPRGGVQEFATSKSARRATDASRSASVARIFVASYWTIVFHRRPVKVPSSNLLPPRRNGGYVNDMSKDLTLERMSSWASKKVES